MGNDDRPKKSWRDIDKMREGGGGQRGAPRQRSDPHEDRQQKQYRAALEALFNKGEIGKLADKLVDRMGPPPVRTPAPGPAGDELAEAPPGAAEAAAAQAPAEGLAEGRPEAPAAPAASAGHKKKPVEDRSFLRKKLVEAVGRQEITRAAEKYLERFPLPDDHEFLEQLLEHEQETRVGEAMERIVGLLDRNQPPRRSRALCGKLRYLAETSPSEDLRGKAQALLRRLN